MLTSTVSRTLLLTLSTILLTAPSLFAYDLTGTWAGKWSCTVFDGEKFKDGNKESTMTITQDGDVLNVNIDAGDFLWNGRAIANTEKPLKGEAIIIQCGTDNVPFGNQGEMGRATVKTKLDSPKATFKMLTIFEGGSVQVGTCKYSFKRLDTTDPGNVPCP